MKVKIKKLHPGAIIPKYASECAACFYLHAIVESHEFCLISSAIPQVISTGLSFEIPTGHVMLVYSRSGHGFKNNVRLANCVGVIDSDYRGEVKVKLAADSYDILEIKNGDRVAQAMVIPIDRVELEEVKEL